MTPQEKLKEIKSIQYAQLSIKEWDWILARVEQLEVALNYAFQNAKLHVADEIYKNIYTGPKQEPKSK